MKALGYCLLSKIENIYSRWSFNSCLLLRCSTARGLVLGLATEIKARKSDIHNNKRDCLIIVIRPSTLNIEK